MNHFQLIVLGIGYWAGFYGAYRFGKWIALQSSNPGKREVEAS